MKKLNNIALVCGIAVGTMAAGNASVQAVTLYQSTINTATNAIPSLSGGPATTLSNFTAAAIGTVNTITFEGLTDASVFGANSTTGGTGTVAPGVTLAIVNSPIETTSNSVANNGISQFSNPTGVNTAYGFNTTTGGNSLLRLSPVTTGANGTITFTFASPISAFGLYITDYGNTAPNTGTLSASATTVTSSTFSLGTVTRALASGSDSSTRAVLFYGFTNAASDPLVSKVTFTVTETTADRFAFDDIKYATAVVPEPLTMTGGALAMGLGFLLKRKKNLKK